MAELVVVGFDNPTDADRVLTELTRLQKEYLIDLEDAVVAIRSPDGTVRIKQSVNLVSLGAASGGLRGALWGSLIGHGINDDFIKGIGATLKPETSALFLLIRKSQPEKVLAELAGFKAHVIRSSLSPEQEAKLQAALSRAQSPSPSDGVAAAGSMATQPTL